MTFHVTATIEIPYQSNVKYEICPDGKIKVDRILSTSMVYPGNYGYIDNTLSEDGDPLDILIINQTPFYPGTVVECRIVGVLETSDENGGDEKIIAVPSSSVDSRYDNINDIKVKMQHSLSGSTMSYNGEISGINNNMEFCYINLRAH